MLTHLLVRVMIIYSSYFLIYCCKWEAEYLLYLGIVQWNIIIT